MSQFHLPRRSQFFEYWDTLAPASQRELIAAVWDMHRLSGNVSNFEILRQMTEYAATVVARENAERGAGG